MQDLCHFCVCLWRLNNYILSGALPTWKFTFDNKTKIQNIGNNAIAQATITEDSKIVSVPERPGNVLQVSGAAALSVLSDSDETHECYL